VRDVAARGVATSTHAHVIAAVVLAAGSARRFDGTQKLLAPVPYRDSTVPLVRLTVLGLCDAGIQRVIVVGGREAAMVQSALDGLDVGFVTNAAYEAGMSGSLRVGVAGAMSRWPDVIAVLIALGDQPLLGTGIIESLVTCFGQERANNASTQIVAPRFRGAMSAPVLFARELVPELLALTGDRGARTVVERDSSRVRYMDFDHEPPIDIDTLDDLAAFQGQRK